MSQEMWIHPLVQCASAGDYQRVSAICVRKLFEITDANCQQYLTTSEAFRPREAECTVSCTVFEKVVYNSVVGFALCGGGYQKAVKPFLKRRCILAEALTFLCLHVGLVDVADSSPPEDSAYENVDAELHSLRLAA